MNELIDHLMKESAVDYTGLWYIISNVKSDGLAKTNSSSDVRLVTMDVIRILLEKGLIAGTFDRIKPEIIDLPIDEIIRKINVEWDELGREFDIGEGISFVAPSFLPHVMSS